MEERIARIEGIMEQMDKRLNHIETRLDSIERRLDSNFKWTLGILITSWITVIAAIVLRT